MAIDVDKVIQYLLFGQGSGLQPLPKQTDYYNAAVRPLPYDPAGALKLLEEAGWRRNKEGWLEKNGKRFQFTLITNSGNELRKAILTVAQDAWKQIGIDVRTDLLEWAVFIQERVNKLDFDALILAGVWDRTRPLSALAFQSDPTYQLNFVGFKNEAADDLIIKIRQEYDHDQQVGYCHRLHEIIAREQPYTFLYVSKWTAVLDKRIVVKETDSEGKVIYKKITPTKLVTTCSISTDGSSFRMSCLHGGGMIHVVIHRPESSIRNHHPVFRLHHFLPGHSPRPRRAQPGGPLNPKFTPEMVERFRQQFHLDKPLYIQYAYFIVTSSQEDGLLEGQSSCS